MNGALAKRGEKKNSSTKAERPLVWSWRQFDQLSLHEMQAMFALRQKIFVVEQNCPYLDIDGLDQQAHHLLAWDREKLVATLRVFERYSAYQNRASIGRICTAQSVRNQGVGRDLVTRAIQFIKQNFPCQSVQIGAQYYLKGWYEGFDFKQCSEIYDEDGIKHILMVLN